MTGITSPYEAPDNADIEIKTEEESIETAAMKIVNEIMPKLKVNDE